MNYDVTIIGGGAAGLFCAGIASQRGLKVLVLESANKLGKKILMSGGGRCNFTNLSVEPKHFLSANPHFCKSALARYRPQHFIELVERHGVAYHEKELGQLFCDDSAKEILRVLLTECEYGGAQLLTQASVSSVAAVPEGFAIDSSRGCFTSRKLVVATGGLSVPTLGGSGLGYTLAKQFGHQLLPTRAGLVPLTISGQPLADWAELSGLSLPVTASAGGAEFSNQMLITHRGLSGPALLQISNYWQPGQPLRLQLLANALAWLQQQQKDRPNAEVKTILAQLFAKRFAEKFAELYSSPKPIKQLDHKTLAALAHTLEHWPVTPNGTEGYRTAEVTLGGVDTAEVSSSSFESKRQPGLYFVGEVLDVTGWLGGYNFQWAWASGGACGLAV